MQKLYLTVSFESQDFRKLLPRVDAPDEREPQPQGDSLPIQIKSLRLRKVILRRKDPQEEGSSGGRIHRTECLFMNYPKQKNNQQVLM